MRLDNDATHLADAQSRRKETAKREKGVFGTRFCIPRMRGPEPRQRTPSSALLLNSYAFLNVQVTLPKESLSPSLIGVALSGSRRLPLMRVEFVLFRSVTV
jgi:hypothetical protein